MCSKQFIFMVTFLLCPFFLHRLAFVRGKAMSLWYESAEDEEENIVAFELPSTEEQEAYIHANRDARLRRRKRDGDRDFKNFKWTFSVESPTIQVNPNSRRFPQASQQNMPEVSVQFFDGFKSFGAPGEHESRLQLESSDPRDQPDRGGRAEGWDGSKSVFIGYEQSQQQTPQSRECCGPYYPFRTCCKT